MYRAVVIRSVARTRIRRGPSRAVKSDSLRVLPVAGPGAARWSALRASSWRPQLFAARSFSSEPNKAAESSQEAQARDVRAERRAEVEALRKATPGSLRWFALKFNPIYRKLYVVDSVPTLSMWMLLFPLLLLAVLWLFAQLEQDQATLQFINDHFRCSLQNLSEGRYHTVLTSLLAPATDGWAAFTVGTLVPVIAFASNLIRNLGVAPTLFAVLGGHLMLTSVLLGCNYIQLRGIHQLRDSVAAGEDIYNLSNHSDGRHRADIKGEKRKVVFALSREAGTVNIAALEKQQYAVLDLSDDEFLDLAEARYQQRFTSGLGAGFALSAVACRLHPLGLLAVPFAPLPFLGIAAAQAGLSVVTLKSYAAPESIAAFGATFMLPFAAFHIFRRANPSPIPVREMPEALLKRLGLSDWSLAARNPQLPPTKPTAPDSLSRIFQAGAQLTKEQVESMRKRNEKFQRRSNPVAGTKVINSSSADQPPHAPNA